MKREMTYVYVFIWKLQVQVKLDYVMNRRDFKD